MYRLYTEDKNRAQIQQILGSRFDGYTLIPALGFWKGKQEASLVIELDTNNGVAVELAAADIKAANQQEAVLVTHDAVQTQLV